MNNIYLLPDRQITIRNMCVKITAIGRKQKNPQRQELTLRTHIKYYIYVYLFIYEPS